MVHIVIRLTPKDFIKIIHLSWKSLRMNKIGNFRFYYSVKENVYVESKDTVHDESNAGLTSRINECIFRVKKTLCV